MILKISENRKKEGVKLQEALNLTLRTRELVDEMVAMYSPRVYQEENSYFMSLGYMEEISLLVELYEFMLHIIMKESMKEQHQLDDGMSLLEYHILYKELGNRFALNEVGSFYRCIQEKYNYSLDFLRKNQDNNHVRKIDLEIEAKNNPEEKKKIQDFADIFFEKRSRRIEQYEQAANTEIDFWGQLEVLLEKQEDLQMCISEKDEIAIYLKVGEVLELS